VTPSELEDPEANTLRMWERQLNELTRKRCVSLKQMYKGEWELQC